VAKRLGCERLNAQSDAEVLPVGGGGHDIAQGLDGVAVAADQSGGILGVEEDIEDQAIVFLGLSDGNLIPMGDQRSNDKLKAFSQSQGDIHG